MFLDTIHYKDMPDESWSILDITIKRVTWIIVDFGVPDCCIKIEKLTNPQNYNNNCLVKFWILSYIVFGITWNSQKEYATYQLVCDCTNRLSRKTEAYSSVSEAIPGIKRELLRIFDCLIKND